MRRLWVQVAIVLCLLFLTEFPALSQQLANGGVLSNETLIKLVGAGLSDDVIVGLIASQSGQYSVHPDAVIALKEAGVSNNVIEAMVDKTRNSVSKAAPAVHASKPDDLQGPLPPPTSDPLRPGKARKLTVVTVSHSTTARNFTITTQPTINTNCNVHQKSVNCTSNSYGGGSQDKAVYRFVQVVTATEGGKVTQYTLSRTARWIWSSTTYLTDGQTFAAEIKGKQMLIKAARGGNQGKIETLKYDIVDIRPVP